MTEFLDRTMNTLRNSPIGPLVNWVETHARLAAWIILSTGMVVLLIIEARDVGLLPGQWIALIVMTILVAGACVWIISWEDSPPETDQQEEEDNQS